MKRLSVIRTVQEFYEVPSDEVVSEATFVTYSPGVSYTLGIKVTKVSEFEDFKPSKTLEVQEE